jgi:hypothetical protein
MTEQKMTPRKALVKTTGTEGIKNTFGIDDPAHMDALNLFQEAAGGPAPLTVRHSFIKAVICG